MIVRPARPDDATEIAYIFNHYIATSHATFETEPVDTSEILQRLESGLAADMPFLVCEADGDVVGYALAQQYRQRPAYMHSVETSVYVRPGHDGRGIATSLYERLMDDLASRRIRIAVAGISLPNEVSIHLHEKFGFTKAGHLAEIGYKFGRWIDVGYWHLFIDEHRERPS